MSASDWSAISVWLYDCLEVEAIQAKRENEQAKLDAELADSEPTLVTRPWEADTAL